MDEWTQFHTICQNVVPERISILTHYNGWEDRIVMKGPNLHVSYKVLDEDAGTVRVSDERGMSVEVRCEGIEMIEIKKDTPWDFEAHIYFFTFEGFARLNIIGRVMNLSGELLENIHPMLDKKKEKED